MSTPIDLVGGFYTDDSLPWSCQDTVNYLPVAAEASGTRTPAKLVDAPGLRPWVEIHGAGPSRGAHDVEGRLFIVAGRTLYEISSKGVAIPRGTIPGVGRVSMAHNQRGHGHELLVVNGSGGYVYNTGDDTFTVVTDPGFPGAGVADFLDGYLMQVEPFGRFLFHSDLADALEYNTLDRFEAETAPDRVVGMIVNHQEVWAFGDRTIDVFANAGTAQGTFQNKGVSISRGCAAKWSPAIIDNGVAWLGDDRVVYHARGYDPVRISTRAIETALSEHSLTDIRNAFSFVWSDRGHSVYYLTIPNGQTFGYDFSTGLWHRRASWHPEWDVGGRWRLSDLVRSNGRWIGADYRDSRLYVLDWDYMLEGSEPLIRERVSPVNHAEGRRFTVDGVELVYDTGGLESECVAFPVQPEGPSIVGSAPAGVVGVDYPGFTYTATEGDAAIVSRVVLSGGMPSGLAFDPDTLSISAGTPTESGDFPLRVRITDANGLWAEVDDTIRVSDPVVAFRVRGSTLEYMIVSPDWTGSWQGAPEFFGATLYKAISLGSRILIARPSDGGVLYTDDLFETVQQSNVLAAGGYGRPWAVGDSVYWGRWAYPGSRSEDRGEVISTMPGINTIGPVCHVEHDGSIRLVCAVSDLLYTSDDEGENWVNRTPNTPFVGTDPSCWSDGETVRYAGNSGSGAPSIKRSSDGITFTGESLPVEITDHLLAVCENGGVWVVGSRDGKFAWRSGDSEWALAEDDGPIGPIQDIKPYQDGFIAIGGGGAGGNPDMAWIKTSADGKSWVTRRSQEQDWQTQWLSIVVVTAGGGND